MPVEFNFKDISEFENFVVQRRYRTYSHEPMKINLHLALVPDCRKISHFLLSPDCPENLHFCLYTNYVALHNFNAFQCLKNGYKLEVHLGAYDKFCSGVHSVARTLSEWIRSRQIPRHFSFYMDLVPAVCSDFCGSHMSPSSIAPPSAYRTKYEYQSVLAKRRHHNEFCVMVLNAITSLPKHEFRNLWIREIQTGHPEIDAQIASNIYESRVSNSQYRGPFVPVPAYAPANRPLPPRYPSANLSLPPVPSYHPPIGDEFVLVPPPSPVLPFKDWEIVD